MEESSSAEVGHRDLPSQAVEKAGLQGKLQELEWPCNALPCAVCTCANLWLNIAGAHPQCEEPQWPLSTRDPGVLLFSIWICYQTVLRRCFGLFLCLPPLALLQSGRSCSGPPQPGCIAAAPLPPAGRQPRNGRENGTPVFGHSLWGHRNNPEGVGGSGWVCQEGQERASPILTVPDKLRSWTEHLEGLLVEHKAELIWAVLYDQSSAETADPLMCLLMGKKS